jgi:hypothetical protein
LVFDRRKVNFGTDGRVLISCTWSSPSASGQFASVAWIICVRATQAARGRHSAATTPSGLVKVPRRTRGRLRGSFRWQSDRACRPERSTLSLIAILMGRLRKGSLGILSLGADPDTPDHALAPLRERTRRRGGPLSPQLVFTCLAPLCSSDYVSAGDEALNNRIATSPPQHGEHDAVSPVQDRFAV